MIRAVRSFVVAAATLTLGCGGLQELSLCAGDEATSSIVRVASADEPGEPMVVSGQVWVGRHRTPVEGARILVYHTNVEGEYAKDGTGYLGAYLCGVARTDDTGGYRLETIRPGPHDRAAPHIHYDVRMPWGDRFFDAVTFPDSARLGDVRPGASWEEIRPAEEGEDGVQYVHKDVWLRY